MSGSTLIWMLWYESWSHETGWWKRKTLQRITFSLGIDALLPSVYLVTNVTLLNLYFLDKWTMASKCLCHKCLWIEDSKNVETFSELFENQYGAGISHQKLKNLGSFHGESSQYFDVFFHFITLSPPFTRFPFTRFPFTRNSIYAVF